MIPIVLCALCGEPFELAEGAPDLVCGCTRDLAPIEVSPWRRVDLEAVGEDLVGWAVLAARYGVLDGRPRSLDEVARARRTSRAKVRAIEGRALRRWRELAARASA